MSFHDQINAELDGAADTPSAVLEDDLQVWDINDVVTVLAKRIVALENGGGGGGSQPVLAKLAFTHSTPGYFSGLDLYESSAGDVLTGGYQSLPTAWDGSTPTVVLYMEGDDPQASSITAVNATPANSAFASFFVLPTLGLTFAALLPTGVLKVAVVDGNAGGDPGSTQGVAEVWVVIAPA